MNYKCEVCKLEYTKAETAKACQEWCSSHDSCNFLIAKQAINKNQLANQPPEKDERYHHH